MSSSFHVGVEGGGTGSKGIILNGYGKVLAEADTAGTNHWDIGYDTTAERILDLIDDLLMSVNACGSTILSAGLSLSGADSPSCGKNIADALYKLRPGLITGGDNRAKVYNDSKAALETATDQGGMLSR